MDLLKILLVEDNPTDQLIVQRLAGYAGFEVELAGNGQEAIEKLSASHYDLVLMDLEMPIMNGYETTTYIRHRLESKKDIPIIIITGREDQGEATRCLLMGANTFLTKPVTEENLIKEINTLML
jgi:CheY-like chemotaxis protein